MIFKKFWLTKPFFNRKLKQDIELKKLKEFSNLVNGRKMKRKHTSLLTGGRPTLNKYQNLIQYHKNMKKVKQPRKMRYQSMKNRSYLQQYFHGKLSQTVRYFWRPRLYLGLVSVPLTIILFANLYPKLKSKSGGDGSYNLGYASDDPVLKFVRPKLSYWDRFRVYIASVVHNLLTDPTIEQEGLNFLDRVFRHAQTQEAGLHLLTQVLQDQRFMDEAQVFGTDLIAYVIARDRIQGDFKDIVLKTLDDPKVKQETVNLLKYILSNKESEEIMARYFNTVFLREDILENLTILLTEASCNAIADEQTRDMFQSFITQIAENKVIKQSVLDNYVYQPVKSFFSFGYLQADEEAQLIEEQKIQQHYQRQVAATDYGKKEYPGYEENTQRNKESEVERKKKLEEYQKKQNSIMKIL